MMRSSVSSMCDCAPVLWRSLRRLPLPIHSLTTIIHKRRTPFHSVDTQCAIRTLEVHCRQRAIALRCFSDGYCALTGPNSFPANRRSIHDSHQPSLSTRPFLPVSWSPLSSPTYTVIQFVHNPQTRNSESTVQYAPILSPISTPSHHAACHSLDHLDPHPLISTVRSRQRLQSPAIARQWQFDNDCHIVLPVSWSPLSSPTHN